jgi:hypothetical protein
MLVDFARVAPNLKYSPQAHVYLPNNAILHRLHYLLNNAQELFFINGARLFALGE